MPTNQYLAFGTAGGANTLSYAAYSATSALIGSGYVAGEADAQHINTVLRQVSVAAAGVAKFSTDYGALDCLDDGSPTNYALALRNAIDAIGRALVPPGTVIAYAANTAPAGWLEANGAVVSRTTYANLFAAIGTTYNTGGEAGTDFRLPELRGEFIRGWDNSRGMDPARAFGSAQGGAVQTHTHPIELSGVDVGGARAADSSGTVTFTSTTLTNTAPSGADETRPRNVALMFCIKT